MNVTLYVNVGEHPSIIVSTTIGQFFADNIDVMDASEIDAIEQALTNGETYYGGGGAAPEWSLKRTD
jgi:hypothetical protein